MLGQTISHYRIVEKIGEGGMGVVYKAEDTKLARVVALKFLGAHLLSDVEAKQRFLREAQAAAALNHPNICIVHEIDEADGRTFIAMACVEGESLEQKIARGPLPVKEALDIAQQIAKGLQAAHNKGIIHRDIKPANILVARDGQVTIMDFGLARLTEASRLTNAGSTMGTAAYMSPEQAQGLEIDHRCDIWALGVVLYEMICGQRPFRGEYNDALFYEISHEEPAPLTGLRAGLPMELEWITAKALAKESDHRYQHAQDMVVDLLNLSDKLRSGRSAVFRGGISPSAGSPPGTPAPDAGIQPGESAASAGDVQRQASQLRRQSRLTWGLGVAAVLAVAAALALAWVHFRETKGENPVYEFTLDLPPDTTLHTLALSPNGRHLALALSQARGGQRLWVRSTDAREPRELPGTDGAQYPFWSPDSRHVGFFAEGKLKKVALAGGPPQSLCDAEDARGGTWNAEGVIVFSPSAFGELRRVSEGGGEPVAVFKADESGQPVSRRFPWFLPDGRHFLYTEGAQGPERTGIFLGSLEAIKPRRLLADDSNAVYAQRAGDGSGVILFVRENGLMAQPFDSSTLEVTGDVFPLAESVGRAANRGNYGFSVSGNGSLLYAGGSGSSLFEETQLAWFDRAGKQLQQIGKPAALAGFSLSPDETRATLDVVKSGAADIWVLEFARGTMSRLTTNSGAEGMAAWSPDGTRIAFTSSLDGKPNLYQKDAGGAGKEEALLQATDTSVSGVQLMDWSKDGRFLLCRMQQPRTRVDLWVVPLEGDRKPLVYLQSEFREDWPRFSPDSRWVAYHSDESGRFEVYIRPFPAADRKWQISTQGGSSPIWSKDGRELYYLAPDLTLMAVALKTGDAIEAGPPNGLFATRVPTMTSGAAARLYEVSRDGRFLIASRLDDGQQDEERTLVMVSNWMAKLGE